MNDFRPHDSANFADCLAHHALHTPDALAYRFLLDGNDNEALLDYAGLEQRARAVAASLQQDCAQGSRVLLLLAPGFDYIASFFGCLKAGMVAVPAYPPSTSKILDRLDAIIRDCQPAAAITSGEHLEAVCQRLQHAAPGARLLAAEAITPDGASDWRPVTVAREDLAFLQYTSGSTGDPKGVMISHANLLHNSATIQRHFDNRRDSHVVSWLPPYHDMGLIGGILQSAFVGCATTLLTPIHFLQRPVRWLRAVSRYQATASGGPNFAFELCVRKIKDSELEGIDLSSWEVAFNGAENVRAATLEAFEQRFAALGFRRSASFPCYGLAEGTLLATSSGARRGAVVRDFDARLLEDNLAAPVAPSAASQIGRALVSSGHGLPGEEPCILDPLSDDLLPQGRVGEICIRGASVAGGYWGRPEASAEVFGRDDHGRPLFRSGDLGFILDGELYVTGRCKDLIILNGVNHHPGDIEASVCREQSCFRPDGSAAFAIELDDGERVVVAQEMERRALRELDLGEVLAGIRASLWQQHRLSQPLIVLLQGGSLPRTSSGKVKRQECRRVLGALLRNLLAEGGGEAGEGETIARSRVIAVESAGKLLDVAAEAESAAS